MSDQTGIRLRNACSVQLKSEASAAQEPPGELSSRERASIGDACSRAYQNSSIDKEKYYQAARQLKAKYDASEPPSVAAERERQENLDKVIQVVTHPLDTAKQAADSVKGFFAKDLPEAATSLQQGVQGFFGQFWG